MPIIRIPGRASRVPSKGGKAFKGGKRPSKGPNKLPPPPRRDSISSVASSSSLSSPANLSNTDGYSGVDDVSDSDDDDADHVLAAEQEHIAKESSSPRPTLDFNMDDDDEADDADDDDSDDDLSTPPREMHKTPSGGVDFAVDDSSSEDDNESWNGFNDEQDQPPKTQDALDDSDATPLMKRHVHFELPHSDSESDDDDDNHDSFFPDIFVPEEALDSRFRQEIGQDNDNYSSDSQTYWDHHGDEDFEGFSEDDQTDFNAFYQNDLEINVNNGFLPLGPLGPLGPAGSSVLSNEGGAPGNDLLGFQSPATDPNNPFWEVSLSNDATAASTPSMVPDLPVESEDDSESDDGYESDGETTEEDEPVLIPKESPRRRSMSGGSSDAEPFPNSPFARRPNAPRKRICVLNPITQKLMVLHPPPPKRALPPPGTNNDAVQPDFLSLQTMSFMSADSMHGGLGPLDPFDDTPWPLGYIPPLDFNPALTPALFPQMSSEGSSIRTDEDDDEEDEGERDLDVDLFLDFDSDDSDAGQGNGDNAEGDAANDGKAGTADQTSGDGGDKPTTAFDKLAHLGGMNVGAFRRNQTNQQLIARGEATPDSLAFSNPLFNGTLRGIRNGALPAAATSLTPERRRKPQSAKSPLEVASLKRRASGAQGGAHKKHKSISDVGAMRL